MKQAINRALGLFCDDDGQTYPITNWLDTDGEECAQDEAVVAVAGTEGRWFSLLLADFDGATQ